MKQYSVMKIASVIITYNRVIHAKIQMDIIKNLWSKEKELNNIDIYHSFNGPRNLYPKKYIENHLIRCKNPGFYEGATLLINTALSKIFKQKVNYDFIIVTSADVWLIKPAYLCNVLNKMKKKNYQLATSIWYIPNQYATEFFIISPQLAKDVFPLNLSEYKLITTLGKKSVKIRNLQIPILEFSLANKVGKVVKKNPIKYGSINESVYFIPGRKYVHPLNRSYSPQIGYYSHHNLNKKISLISQSFIGKYTSSNLIVKSKSIFS